MNNLHFYLWGPLLILLLSGCSGLQTFPNAVRAGDTAALAAGWKSDFSRDNITVHIVDSAGTETVYLPGNTAVRAVVNFYPDPLSSIIVADRTSVEMTPYANTYANVINGNFTGNDRDWWQTIVFVDLPATLAEGNAQIQIENTAGDIAWSAVNIISGGGTPTVFDAELAGHLSSVHLSSLERTAHYEINFTGTVPHAVQIWLSHDPDKNNGGTGKAFVVNPHSDFKNTLWSDNGSQLQVILTPSGVASLTRLEDLKFYVTGGVTGLQVTDVNAFDINGNAITDVAAVLKSGH